MKPYLVFDRLGRFLFETPATSAAEAKYEAKAIEELLESEE